MEIYSKIKPLHYSFWTYDTIFYNDWVGSIRDPIIIVTKSGIEMVPTTLVYQKGSSSIKPNQLFDSNYKKRLFEYGDVNEYKNQFLIDRYIVTDMSGHFSMFAMPLCQSSKVRTSSTALMNLLRHDLPVVPILNRVLNFFPGISFGLFGSYALGINYHKSDIDLVVKGGKDFQNVVYMLRQPLVQKKLAIRPLSKKEVLAASLVYRQRYNISLIQALYIAKQRIRYLATFKNDTGIKITFSSCFKKEEYQTQTILGSKKIKKVAYQATVVDATHASSFPREYKIRIMGEIIPVLTTKWSLRNMAKNGDSVKLVGILREKAGNKFISIENSGDFLFPYCN